MHVSKKGKLVWKQDLQLTTRRSSYFYHFHLLPFVIWIQADFFAGSWSSRGGAGPVVASGLNRQGDDFYEQQKNQQDITWILLK